VFVGGPTPERIKYYADDIRKRAAAHGRNPEHVKVICFLTVIVAETSEEAEAKYEEYNELWSANAAKSQFGGASGYDLAEYEKQDQAQPFEFKKTEHGHYKAASLTKDASKQLSIKEALSRLESIDRNTVFIGNPIEVADQIQHHFETSGVDGYNLNHLVTPSCLEDFIDLVIPILQERGLYKTEYKEGSLRQKLFSHGESVLPDDHPGSKYTAGRHLAHT
jgi:alkanesulfonate monooxygenase SsuD/methylene tetrahydromethanopterin reductase-like flavin-dependent oxidoreductase (luciferase family)